MFHVKRVIFIISKGNLKSTSRDHLHLVTLAEKRIRKLFQIWCFCPVLDVNWFYGVIHAPIWVGRWYMNQIYMYRIWHRLYQVRLMIERDRKNSKGLPCQQIGLSNPMHYSINFKKKKWAGQTGQISLKTLLD